MLDAEFMRRCIELARKAEGRTAPNPMVGAIVVLDGLVIAEGWHEGPGLAHAEVDAFRKLHGSAKGATLYVNLEPCCHYGRTPPCTDAVLASGVQRVVAGMIDPCPLVCGRGVEILRAAGIEVVVGVEEELCRELNMEFILAQRGQGKGAEDAVGGVREF
jgi:diaminohydroxyphosphoribosylaminopyrimidine deaminase/5-amino-6-(5-phosphoribosylamino)uracil reductase